MKRLKLYLETSVWNFLFADDAPEKRASTEIFFAEVETGRYDIFVSEVVMAEIEDAPKDKYEKLRASIERYSPKALTSDEESDYMVEAYLKEGLLSPKNMVDLTHLSIASVNDMDMLISWNLRHLVKARTRMLANAINRMNGYHDIEICTPGEAIEDEN
jgi:hypothetical protein